jgi:hypothetical protein
VRVVCSMFVDVGAGGIVVSGSAGGAGVKGGGVGAVSGCVRCGVVCTSDCVHSSHSLHRSRCALAGRGYVHMMHLLLVDLVICSPGGGVMLALPWYGSGPFGLREFSMASFMSVGFHHSNSAFTGLPSSDSDVGPGCSRL